MKTNTHKTLKIKVFFECIFSTYLDCTLAAHLLTQPDVVVLKAYPAC